MDDIQAKYSKLANEYAKLKSQIPVLKKAVLDEQATRQELTNQISQQGTSIRKQEQEIDSLAFRNQQLAARVEVLQKELDAPSKDKKKGKSVNNAMNVTNDSLVLNQELQSKIEENARLHKQVFEATTSHELELQEVRSRLQELEEEKSKHGALLEDAQTLHSKTLNSLREEKATLEVRLQKQESAVRDSITQRDEAVSELAETKELLTNEREKLQNIRETKLQFDDSEFPELHSLNIPPYHRQLHAQGHELIGQASAHVKDFVQALSNFYTYYEQRTQIMSMSDHFEKQSELNIKMCGLLRENVTHLRPLQTAYEEFVESSVKQGSVAWDTSTGLTTISETFKDVVSYARKISSYQLLSLDEENSVSSCPNSLCARNVSVQRALQGYCCALQRLAAHLELLSAHSCASRNGIVAHPAQTFAHLAQAFTHLNESFKDLSQQYNAKVGLEHELPTATQRLKTTDEFIISALLSLVTVSGKLSAFISGNISFFNEVTAINRTPSHPAVASFRKRTAEYLASIATSRPESVPYATAVENRRTLLSSTESREALLEQVNNFHARLSKLEQEKEHWMLEAQLQQMKCEKETQKNSEISQRLMKANARLTGSIEDNMENVEDVESTSENAHSEAITPNSEQTEAREGLIKEHYATRLHDVTVQMQEADSKALHYHAECRALRTRLDLTEEKKTKTSSELDEAKKNITQLKDELQTTTRSYEGQLSMMSEHLAAMNEKLSTQTEEITALKFQVTANANVGSPKSNVGRLKKLNPLSK